MSSTSPERGQFSADGMFQWDGQAWQPLARGHRLPTAWTRPMQMAVAAYLVLGLILSVTSTALFLNAASVERVSRAQNPSLTDDQVQQAAGIAVAVGWTVVVVIALVSLVLALGSYLGWRWVFWADLAWLALSSIGVVTNLAALANPSAQAMPAWVILTSLALSLAALALLVWFIVAAARYGPWAMARPGPT